MPTASSSLPGTQVERAAPLPPIWPCSEWGLPCDPCYQRPGALLPHLFTLTCAASGHRRFVFCGTFRRLTTPGRYPAPCPVELGLSSRDRSHRRSSLATLKGKMAAPCHRSSVTTILGGRSTPTWLSPTATGILHTAPCSIPLRTHVSTTHPMVPCSVRPGCPGNPGLACRRAVGRPHRIPRTSRGASRKRHG